MLLKQKRIYRADLRSNPDTLYLFGDNESRRGLGGQAKEMRGEPNAVGVRTKRKPSLKEADFWTDESLAKNCQMIDDDLAPARQHLVRGGTVVLPEDGLGTGLAQLQQRAPQTFAYLEQAIQGL